MAAVAALLEPRTAGLLRRALPRGGPRVVSCRNAGALDRLLAGRLIDAVVLAPAAVLQPEVAAVRDRLPGIPVVLYGPFRPDDAGLLLAVHGREPAGLAVEGVDDPIIGELVLRASATARRRRALADGPRLLRLTEPLQQRVWELAVTEVERPLRTDGLARRLAVSREHLSRQFGAGGAPNLKRVIDLGRVAAAAQLLGNPGYGAAAVAALLHFASASHLAATARRIAGVGTAALGALGPAGVLRAFAGAPRRDRRLAQPVPL